MPAPLVLVAFELPVSTDVIFTSTLGTTAPVESVTVPVISPPFCALASYKEGTIMNSIINNLGKTRRFGFRPCTKPGLATNRSANRLGVILDINFPTLLDKKKPAITLVIVIIFRLQHDSYGRTLLLKS